MSSNLATGPAPARTPSWSSSPCGVWGPLHQGGVPVRTLPDLRLCPIRTLRGLLHRQARPLFLSFPHTGFVLASWDRRCESPWHEMCLPHSIPDSRPLRETKGFPFDPARPSRRRWGFLGLVQGPFPLALLPPGSSAHTSARCSTTTSTSFSSVSSAWRTSGSRSSTPPGRTSTGPGEEGSDEA